MSGILPEEMSKSRVRTITKEAKNYVLNEDNLYRRGKDDQLQMCVTEEEYVPILEQTHSGQAGNYFSADKTAKAILVAGIWWPTLFVDAEEFVKDVMIAKEPKLLEAHNFLRQLPASDPRQYSQQANVHCAFCDAACDENGTQIEYQVHNSWLFFAWHRWYLYFHERILATLIEDDTFALPFWNWDSASGYSSIPPLQYNDSSSSFYDANRNLLHGTPAVVDLNFTKSNSSEAVQLACSKQLHCSPSQLYRPFSFRTNKLSSLCKL
ncbi:hypothetical protein L7F22_046757 [Adiantum nelumboides]|nr:hypothetical protein [Adiantum nelumboides]